MHKHHNVDIQVVLELDYRVRCWKGCKHQYAGNCIIVNSYVYTLAQGHT